uniref:Uncharacterized protein n=1 Tax=Schizaphis graminum TaxID=13262 RepID=A0A2S2NIX9_SCHGA
MIITASLLSLFLYIHSRSTDIYRHAHKSTSLLVTLVCVCVCTQGPTFRGFKLFIGPRGSAGRVWGTVHRATQGVRPYILYIYIFFSSPYIHIPHPPSFSVPIVRRGKKGFFKIYILHTRYCTYNNKYTYA